MRLFEKLLLYALLSLFVVCRAHAQDIGSGIVCDTQAQLETYYGLTGHGVPQSDAIQTVNVDAKATACVIALVVYHRGNTLTTIQSPNGHIDIVEILVVIVHLNGEWTHVPPTIQYTGFYSKDEPA